MWSREYFGLTNGGEESNPGQSGWPLSGEAWEIYPVTEYDDVIKDIMHTKVQAPPVHSQHMQVGQQLQEEHLLGRDGKSGGQGDAREGNLSVMMSSRTLCITRDEHPNTLTAHLQCQEGDFLENARTSSGQGDSASPEEFHSCFKYFKTHFDASEDHVVGVIEAPAKSVSHLEGRGRSSGSQADRSFCAK